MSRSELVPAFVRLLRDNEAEVRVAAAGKLSAFCKILAGEAVISALLPCVKELSTDGSQFVRTALAGVVMELAPLLVRQFPSAASVCPVLQQALAVRSLAVP